MLEILRKTGALLEGHFLLSSGKHSSKYIQCAKLFENPDFGDQIGEMIAEKVKHYNPDVIIGPAIGGVILSYVVARALKVKAIFAERESGTMKLRRDFKIEKGNRVVIVEDVTTTGGSVMEVAQIVEKCQGQLCCVASIVDRSVQPLPFNVPFYSLIRLQLPIYEPDSCPLCKEGIPLFKPGSR
ncbi:orotate phosphoribosyltransferase [Pseudothermotoga elfii]